MAFYITENSVIEPDSIILVDGATYRTLGIVKPIEHGNFQATIYCGRRKGDKFQSQFRDVCEAWIGSTFYSRKKRSI